MASWNDDRLELALRASREGIWDWDLENNSIYYSGRVLRFLGYRRKDAPNLFEKRKELMDEASVAEMDEALRRVSEGGDDLFSAEPRVNTQKGGWRWFRLRGTPVRNDEGKVVRIVGSAIEISKRKQAERELKEERYLIQTLMDSIPMNLYFKDVESRFVMANQATAEKMGFSSSDELIGKSDRDFFHEDHAQVAREMEREIMNTGKGVYDQIEHEKWDDREDTWVTSTKHAWLDRSGKVKGTFGVTNDISDLMRARNEQEKVAGKLHQQGLKIEEERQRMRLIIDSVPMNVYFKNRDSQFVIVNQSMAEWVGESQPSDLYEKSDRDYFSEEHWSGAEADEKAIIGSGEAMVGLVEKETWSGKEDTWVMTSKYPWRDNEGAVVGTFGVSSDVSELISAQREMTEMAESLQTKNKEMEEELSLAREVQQALIPDELPSMFVQSEEGKVSLSFKHLYRPASELAGDFFEVLPLEDDRMGFIISDVMGHGVRSALVVSMLRGLIEQQAGSASDTAEFMTGLNEGLTHLLEESGVVLFATAIYGVLDLRNETVQITVAGHPNPIAVFEDGTRQLAPPAEATGPALGLVSGFEYGSVTAPLQGLRRIICFTDGIFEVMNEWKEEFGIDHMIEVIERGGQLERVLENLVKAAEDFARQGVFDDDLCLLGMEVRR